MFRICGHIIDENKQLFIGLQKIKGIGKTLSIKICNDMYINPLIRVKNLREDQAARLSDHISEYYIIGDDLIKSNIAKVKVHTSIYTFRGRRLKAGLPVRGQRTQSNAKTCKRIRQI